MLIHRPAAWSAVSVKPVLTRVAVLACLSMLPSVALSHPDLVLQIEQLDARIATGQASVELYLKRGDLYRRHGDFDMAASDYATARRIAPDDPVLDFYDGRLFLDRGDPASAESSMARYLSVNPKHAKAWLIRGQANLQMQQPEQAAKYFADAIANSEVPSPELYRLQILSTLATGESHWQSAAQIAENGVRQFGIEVNLLGLAIDIDLALDLPEQAKRHLDSLPPALKSLPQWAKRQKMADCFAIRTEDNSSECLLQATRVLRDQVNEFLRKSATH